MIDTDSILTLFITITIIILLLTRIQFHVINQQIIIHVITLLCIVFLCYIRYDRSAFMIALLYLIAYVQSQPHNIKEYFSSTPGLPEFSNSKTENPLDEKAKKLLVDNNLPSQITTWFNGDSFDITNLQWRDLGSNNHISFNKGDVKLNSGILFSSSNSTASVVQKWISSDTTSRISIPLSVSNNSVTFVHLTRYNPRSTIRGKLWTNESGIWVSGYNDNIFTTTDTDGRNLSIVKSHSKKIDDIMNIRGSNWNLFIDQMDIDKKTRRVMINDTDYVFETTKLDSIPNKIGININVGDKSDWDCAEIMVYPRILDENEIKQIINYFNKKYLIKYPDEIGKNKYNIYNHYTFSSIPDSEWQTPPAIGSTTANGNKLIGITNTEYECVLLCDTTAKPASCNAFSYHMGKGMCYSVDEKNILNHTTPNKAILSGTNKEREVYAQREKEEAERRAREEAERQRLAAIEAERQRLAAIEAERQRQIAAAEMARQQAIQAQQAAIAASIAAIQAASRQRPRRPWWQFW
jgi:hypothetical protein